jgi:ATP-dependent Clp protease ATP-binding subunit ClpA
MCRYNLADGGKHYMAKHVSHMQLIDTPRLTRAMEAAADKAVRLGSDYLGVEHVALGMLEDNGGIFAQALQQLGYSGSAISDAIIAKLAEGGSTFNRPNSDTPAARDFSQPEKKDTKPS